MRQARERWSTTEDVHFRPGHYWLARTVDAGDGTCIIKRVDKRRETINGNLFTNGDYVRCPPRARRRCALAGTTRAAAARWLGARRRVLLTC